MPDYAEGHITLAQTLAKLGDADGGAAEFKRALEIDPNLYIAHFGLGQIFRQKGKGLPNPHGGKGDLYVSVRVITPSKVSREQRKLIEQLEQSLKVENNPVERSSSFFDKVKDIFG